MGHCRHRLLTLAETLVVAGLLCGNTLLETENDLAGTIMERLTKLHFAPLRQLTLLRKTFLVSARESLLAVITGLA